MRVILSGDKIFEDTAVTLGNFDGLHRGHIKLINELKDKACKNNLKTVVYILEKPYNSDTKRILTKEQKMDILNTMGIDYVYFQDFTKDFSNITASRFIQDILVDSLNARLVVVGTDYRFGYNRCGDVLYLQNNADKFGFKVNVMDKIDAISSTAIRKLIQNGNIKEANYLLGRPFCFRGNVVKGLKIGRTIGFRTANLEARDGLVIPGNGVYKTATTYNNKVYKSITNIGNNPTISDLKYKSIETNIFEFNQDIYGENIEVTFLDRIRKEKKFKNINELVAQIRDDINTCRD